MKIARLVLASTLMGAAVVGHTEPEAEAVNLRRAKMQLIDMAKAFGVSDVVVPPVAATKATENKAENAPSDPVEEIMRKNDTVVVDNPLFGGLPFLAFTARENYEGRQNSQQSRAANLCKMLGYDKPILVAVRLTKKEGNAITVDDKGNGTAAPYSFFDVRIHTSIGPTSDYYDWAVFSKIACKK